jgi:regulator of sirC expression with transglutaminase-like and TPR domain
MKPAIFSIILGLILPLAAAEPPRPQPPANESAKPLPVQDLVQQARKSVVVIHGQGRDRNSMGIGSGFLVSDEGLVATNLHVIGQGRPITVELADGSEKPVRRIHAWDRGLDLAVLEIDNSPGLTALPLGDSGKLTTGDPVIALGHPRGLRYSVVTGVVSGIRNIDGRDLVQLAIPIEQGNSGGPVLDRDGRVIGLMTIKSLVTRNLGFAVAVDHLKALLAKPNSVPMQRWVAFTRLDPATWQPRYGARWQRRGGRIHVDRPGTGFGGRSLCLWMGPLPEDSFEVGTWVRLDDEAGAAGLIFCSDGDQRHYGFYPSGGRLRLTRFDGPDVFSWNVLKEIETPHYHANEWNHLKVRVGDDRLLCYVNDQLLIESHDKGLESGRVGLAKFRDTVAEFKQFRVGNDISSGVPAAASIAAIENQIDELPNVNDALPSELSVLTDRSEDARRVLQRRIDRLNRDALRLERLAADIHTHTVVNELAKIVKADNDQIDLAHTALLIARLDNPDLDVAAYRTQMDDIADEIRSEIGDDASDADRLTALDRFLFAENGFHGSRLEYYHPANSYLNRVLDDREGLPIALSVLYLELGRQLGLKIEGVGLPGHFVVRYVPENGEAQLIDPFESGRRLTRDEAADLVRAHAGVALRPEHLAASPPRAIVLRMLRNLLNEAQRQQEPAAVLRYLEAMLAIDDNLVEERLLRAFVRHQTGRTRAAIEDVNWFLENAPDGADLERVHALKRQFEAANATR